MGCGLSQKVIKNKKSKYQFDLFVIGGGSAGIACATEASKLGASVGLADFVVPSPQNTEWGLGGTCVNVGCIPKKLMHLCGNTGSRFRHLGQGLKHDWETMVKNIQKYIKQLNYSYKDQLENSDVKYYNAYATFIDANTVKLQYKGGKTQNIKSKYVLVAVGCRPSFGNIKGAEKLTITSDDLFSLKKPPGKTCVIGASYIALECATFLQELGFQCTILKRSIMLRGFDQEIAQKLENIILSMQIEVQQCQPIEVMQDQGKLSVKGLDSQNKDCIFKNFDTVICAVGRDAFTSKLNLQAAGIKFSEKGKIICNELDQSVTQPCIYALGDVQEGKPELTPVAIKAGQLLARRLFDDSQVTMQYNQIPTTVFTPIEYSCVGYSEEKAKELFGNDIQIVKQEFMPLEWNLFEEDIDYKCFCKWIFHKDQLVGVHLLSENSSQVMQGLAAALKQGISQKQLNEFATVFPNCVEIEI